MSAAAADGHGVTTSVPFVNRQRRHVLRARPTPPLAVRRTGACRHASLNDHSQAPRNHKNPSTRPARRVSDRWSCPSAQDRTHDRRATAWPKMPWPCLNVASERPGQIRASPKLESIETQRAYYLPCQLKCCYPPPDHRHYAPQGARVELMRLRAQAATCKLTVLA